MEKTVLEGAITSFIEKWQKIARYYDDLHVTTGRKYYKVISDGSVHAFIDKEGNIYKSASWNKPASHVRGNVFSVKNGMEAIDPEGFVFYLR